MVTYSRASIRQAAAEARRTGASWLGHPDSLSAVRIFWSGDDNSYALVGVEGIPSVDRLVREIRKALQRPGYPKHLTTHQDLASGRRIGAFGKRIATGKLTRREMRRYKKFCKGK